MRRHRRRLGLSQQDLADKSGVTVRGLRKIESGRIGTPRPVTVRLLADAFGLTGADRDQFCAAAHRQVAVPPRSVTAPAQLPADVAGFVGRDGPLHRLDALVDGAARPAVVLVTAVAGMAGVGKTALAVHWAHRVRDRFPDGQLYVNLRGYDLREPLRPVAALTQLLQAMGVAAEQIPVDVDTAAGLYRSVLSARRVLVLLDNAGSAAQVRPLLPGGKGSLVLVTSRDALRGLVARNGARLLRLDVLSAAESGELIGRLVGVERSAREPEAVARLAELCGHLPLALRVAAATVAARPTAALADQVAAIEAGPLSGLRIAGDPPSDLRGFFQPSYLALSDTDRRLFRLLGLVPGQDFGAATAAALADVDIEWAGAGLDRLAEAHLVGYREPGRFGLHDLLRAYAHELAYEEACTDAEAARDRLLAYYLGHVDAAARLLYPHLPRLAGGTAVPAHFPDGQAALAWLDAELRSLVDAVRSAAGHGRAEVAWLLADGLRGYLALRSRYLDWLAVAEAALAAATAAGNEPAGTAARFNLGMLARATGDLAGAAAHYRQALELARVSGWRRAESTAERNLGSVLVDIGRLDEAAGHVRRCRMLERRLAGRVSEATWLTDGVLRLWMGRLRQATGHLGEAVAEARRLDSRDVLATGLHMLGYTRHLRGQLDQALEALDEAHTISVGLGNTARVALVEANQAMVHRDTGRLDLAMVLARRARTTLRKLGRRFYEPFALTGLASVEVALGRHPTAERHLTAGLALARWVGSSMAEVTVRLGLADLHHDTGRLPAAAEEAQQALVIASRHAFEVSAGQALGTLAEIHLSMMDTCRAVDYAHKALASHRQTGHRPGTAKARAVLARAGSSRAADNGTKRRQPNKVDGQVGRHRPQ